MDKSIDMSMISSRCVALLVMLVPAMALTSAVGGPAVIYLTALISLAVLASNAFTRRQLFDFRELMPMAVALFAPFTAMLISSIWLGVWSASEIEKLLRFALAVPVCWMLLRAPRHWLQHVQWSVLFGAYAGSIMLFVILLHPGPGTGICIGLRRALQRRCLRRPDPVVRRDVDRDPALDVDALGQV